ncbi:MAG TPA: TetR/AcrR family transcriptional regulator [Ktedonobacterales bacterium]|jgi:AcrR family transcriptional regulator|nr:TetR/AcrR family transcriptional regulator [Ktedonobacterales bacterium]
MSSTAPTRRSRAKLDAIHAASQDLFLRFGFADTSMDAIALAANVSKQTLYRYYESKEALFVAVLERLALDHLSASALLTARETPMNSRATLEQALTRWAELSIAQILQPTYVGLVRLLVAELPRFPDLGARFFHAVPQQGSAFLKALMVSARSHGVIVVDDLDLAIQLLIGPLLAYLFSQGLLAAEAVRRPPTPEQIAALVRLALDGIAADRARQEPC